MDLTKIAEQVFPLTKAHRNCRLKRQALEHRRERLKLLIQAFNRGEKVDWQTVGLSADIEKTLKSPA